MKEKERVGHRAQTATAWPTQLLEQRQLFEDRHRVWCVTARWLRTPGWSFLCRLRPRPRLDDQPVAIVEAHWSAMYASRHRYATCAQSVWVRGVPHGSQAERHFEQPGVNTAHSGSPLEGQHSHSDGTCRSDVAPCGPDERVDVLGDTPSRCQRLVCARTSLCARVADDVVAMLSGEPTTSLTGAPENTDVSEPANEYLNSPRAA